MITFTGSTPTGRAIMAAASETLQEGLPRTRRQVGGDRARRRRLRHGGAVHRVRHGQPLRSGLRDHVAAAGAAQAPRRDRRDGEEQLRAWCATATPPTEGTYMGPLISEKQRDKVDGMVKRAVEAGATLVTGGEKVEPGLLLYADAAHRRRPGQRDRPGRGVRTGARRHPPTTTTTTPSGSPTTPSTACPAPCSAARTAPSRWPAASAPAPSRSTAACYFSPDSPFGGYKQSGIGREMGAAGLEEFLERKTFATVVAR